MGWQVKRPAITGRYLLLDYQSKKWPGTGKRIRDDNQIKQNIQLMRKLSMILCATIFFSNADAQQQPQYTQYLINNYILNPALTGIENYTDVKISHRHQWIGLQDAPVTTYLTLHAPLGKKDDRTTATSFDTPGENPRGKNFWQDYEAAKPHSGIGVKIINDYILNEKIVHISSKSGEQTHLNSIGGLTTTSTARSIFKINSSNRDMT